MGRQSVQNVVDSFNDKIFPGLSDVPQDFSFVSGQSDIVYDVKSSLVLQMSLYFNLVYYPVWLVIIFTSFVTKAQCFGWFSYLLLGIGVSTMLIMEATRIYLGMSGNMSEQVTELSTFWFTTLLVQLPLVAIILIVALSLSQVMEVVALSISTSLMAVQLCVSFTTLRNVSRLRQFLKP
ncbi:transmembrane protein 17 [Daphnia magna]|uniref:Transmembrane protein 17 n=2 Tax=Daphnia magna TaxID=35525 RepID=A0A0P5BZ33_9CRUS|nr:transmembrane protein 17 [Daphnia magna]KAK4004615.1 hypothetical protein OUZ56_006347 [Daphnia magna]KZS17833.1 Transmembrane protein 17 [Daphnia magna]